MSKTKNFATTNDTLTYAASKFTLRVLIELGNILNANNSIKSLHTNEQSMTKAILRSVFKIVLHSSIVNLEMQSYHMSPLI